MNDDPGNEALREDHSHNSPGGRAGGLSWLAIGGIGFIYGAVVVFGVVCYMIVLGRSGASKAGNAVLADYLPELILASIGVFGAILGVSLLRSVGLAGAQQPNRVINSQEWLALCDQVKNGDEEAVTQYIRLTSLTGFTGTFTKLGLSGLPLATIGLTLFFSLVSINYPDFMDLAKLTLGAFIGSFVQKQVGVSQSGSVKLPTGETLSVKPSTLP
jgi:hypothetical protein